MPGAMLEVRGLSKHYAVRSSLFARESVTLRAVDGIDLDIDRGEALGLVGESGCGKTTAGRCILRLNEPTAGSIRFEGVELTGLTGEALRRQRRHLQMIFQDPYGSLNPRLTVCEALCEPMRVHGLCGRQAAEAKAAALLAMVGMEPEHLHRYPHEFSGGQRQRIGIARALSVEPRLIICDEPVSALDVSVQAQVLNLLSDLKRTLGLAYLFISHDLAVVAHLCSRVAVMYMGELVETGPVDELYRHPLHPYTRCLIAAVADPDLPVPQAPIPAGEPPGPMEQRSAERLIRRFPTHAEAFRGDEIRWQEAAPGHRVRCARLDVLQDLAGRAEASTATEAP